MPLITKTQNPYGLLGQLLGPGLDAIATATPSTVDDLVLAVGTYIETTFYPSASAQVDIEIGSICYHAINSYQNNLVLLGKAVYNINQYPFIKMLIGVSSPDIQPDTITQWLTDIQENIGISNLTVNEQIPLFLATALGGEAVSYWANQLGGGGSWASYLSGHDYEDYINSLLWDVAAINGSLSGYGATPVGLIEPTTNMVSTNMISALAGALTVTAGKVIFKWIPRIVKPIPQPLRSMPNGNSRQWCKVRQ